MGDAPTSTDTPMAPGSHPSDHGFTMHNLPRCEGTLNTTILHQTSKYQTMGQYIPTACTDMPFLSHCTIGCRASNSAGTQFDQRQVARLTTCNRPVKVPRGGKVQTHPNRFDWDYNKDPHIGPVRGGAVEDYTCLHKCWLSMINNIDGRYKNVNSCKDGYSNYYWDKGMNLEDRADPGRLLDIGHCTNIECNIEDGWIEDRTAPAAIPPYPHPLSNEKGICTNIGPHIAAWSLPHCVQADQIPDHPPALQGPPPPTSGITLTWDNLQLGVCG
jgi:hypothetical protein